MQGRAHGRAACGKRGGGLMELLVLDSQGQRTATLEVSDAVFGREYNEALVHQIVVAYQGNARSGDRAQKNRSAVRHSTKKPWRQKGTGRARSGMTSSPIWRGGGRTFPNSPDENFSQKVNRKMYRAGMAALLSQLAREQRLAVIEDFTLDSPKTKGLVQKLKAMGLDTGLLITDTVDENLYLSARNLPGIGVVEVRYADPVSLMHFPRVVLTKGAIAKLEELMK
jgi:large subunit ribosomal protein L4